MTSPETYAASVVQILREHFPDLAAPVIATFVTDLIERHARPRRAGPRHGLDRERPHAHAPGPAVPRDRATRANSRRGRRCLRPRPPRRALLPWTRAAGGGSGSLRARGQDAARRPLRLSPRAAGPPADAPSRGRADDSVRPSSRPGRVD